MASIFLCEKEMGEGYQLTNLRDPFPTNKEGTNNHSSAANEGKVYMLINEQTL